MELAVGLLLQCGGDERWVRSSEGGLFVNTHHLPRGLEETGLELFGLFLVEQEDVLALSEFAGCFIKIFSGGEPLIRPGNHHGVKNIVMMFELCLEVPIRALAKMTAFHLA